MRLSTIKLSGFKSFVDPTTLHLPTNMTGVVGPNGCGKSNIIDAVRWVMGESTASRLRGDSSTDVIFSGSSARKPVAQATVELIFDNADHTIGGEFAAFNEISVKRVVGRDGQSNYSLNGTRCRRRDITDLFLGTGLGPRSYSIIEQGVISQIIEARPEDLRVYLEEAAGISKYKERRRETENRIRHTRENLDRLNDLRDEVGKQLQHLARQAKQAEQYTQIQAQRKIKDAQWRALEFRGLDAELQAQRESLAQAQIRLQQLIAEQREAEAKIETARLRREQAADVLNQAQATSYEIGGTVARIEQQISHQHDLSARLQQAREEAQTALADLGSHISGDEAQLRQLRAAIADAQPQHTQLQADDEHKQAALRDAEAALTQWQQRWDAHGQEQSEAVRAGDVERTRVDYLDRQALDAGRRREALVSERTGLNLTALASALAQAQQQHDQQKTGLDALTAEVETRKQAQSALQDDLRSAQAELAELRERAQEKRGRLASLETLQHAALGQDQDAAVDWLRQRGLDNAARVGAALSVDPGWEPAVEAALGQMIEGVLVTAPETLVEALGELGEGRLTLVAAESAEAQFASTSLACKVRGPLAIRRLLAKLHVAEDLTKARAMQARLSADESVITRDGARLGSGWIRVLRPGAAKQSALLREAEIQSLRAEIEQLQRRDQELERGLSAWRDRALAAEQQREDAQRGLYLAHRSVSELAGQLQSGQGRLETAQGRIQQIDVETTQLAKSIASAEDQARQARAKLETTVARMAELEQARRALEAQRGHLIAARDAARSAARESQTAAHALALSLESQRAQMLALTQSLDRMGSQRGQLDNRLSELAGQLAEGDSPVRVLEAERQSALERRVTGEKALSQARAALEAVDHELREYEQIRQQRDEQAISQRDQISQRKLDQQALAIKAEQLSQAVAQMGLVMDEVISDLPEDADSAVWEQAVMDFDAKLRRLEPVNLAAISEHTEAEQRKGYLDAQHGDLTTALETLEGAIRKIDRETRGRFKDTFDRVDSGLQALYPRLFGGGHAYLELTGEDLLDTGVAIMARPPGKRVSNISLLSGGEKAMTAVGLVFAIFQLNPAPFCLLDEVDAPLDEANVGRFTSLVKEMSEQVQFLIVTHNKATMETAEQLSGVTMREPGVSRLVSVDLAEAARLAGAA